MKTALRFLAFLLLLSVLVGCAPLASAAGVPTATPTTAPTTLPVASPSATPAAVPTGGGETVIITLADNGKTIQLPTDRSFLIKLGEDYDWQVSFLPQEVFKPVMGVMLVRGAQGLYHTAQPGQADWMATGNPACLKAKPACALRSIEFKVTILVK